MQRRYTIHEGAIVETESENAEILTFINPDKEEFTYLSSRFQLDEHTMQSALDPDELSRLEFESDHFVVIFKRPRNYSSDSQFLFKVSSAGLFVFKEHAIILVSEDVPLFDGKQTYRVSTLNDMLLRLLYRSITHFLQHLRVMNMISDEIEQKVNTSMENKYLIHMFTLEKSLTYYLNAISSNALALEKIRNNSAKIGFTKENTEFLDDIFIENSQCLRQTEIYSNILSSMMDARASIVNNNLNTLMKTLNVVTIGIMVPTFVVSAFSMNVPIPFQKWPYMFFAVIALSILSLIALLAVSRYKKW